MIVWTSVTALISYLTQPIQGKREAWTHKINLHKRYKKVWPFFLLLANISKETGEDKGKILTTPPPKNGNRSEKSPRKKSQLVQFVLHSIL